MKKIIQQTCAIILCIGSVCNAWGVTKSDGLTFRADRTFKIVQFTDIHACPSNPVTQTSIQLMSDVLDKEKPDLVVFTGDAVTEAPAEKGWNLITAPLIERGIPFAVTLGNHDDEQDLNRSATAKLLTSYAGCLFVDTVEKVKGFGNYTIPIKASTANKTAAVLYCIDSNAYSTHKKIDGYGWFGHDQVDWYLTQSAAYTKQNGGTPLPALAFFHIALPEYNQAYNKRAIGTRLEDECSPKINTGMYTAMLESGDVMGTFVGHDHDNDYIADLHGIALTYGRFTGSTTTYTNLEKGARVIVLKEGERSFDSWIRLLDDRIIQQVRFPQSFIKK